MSKRVLLMFAVLAATALACSFSVLQPTPTPIPTATPTATATPTQPPTPTPVPTPTLAPIPTPTPEIQPTETAQALLSDNLYQHPKGLFLFHIPQGWVLSDEGDAYASFSQPDQPLFNLLIVTALNTGYPLENQGFVNIVDAYESSYQAEDNYRVVERIVHSPAARVAKTYDYDNVTYYTVSYYEQSGSVVMILDITVPAEQSDTGDALLEALLDDLRFSRADILNQPIYNDFGSFDANADYYTMLVPLAWTYNYDVSDTLIIDRFDAPDGKAFIESIIYDDGTPFSKSEVGKIALGYLRNAYAEDLKVLDDQVQPDGSERLFWHSDKNHITGLTFFERRGDSTILFLTLASQDDVWDIYEDLFSTILASYTTP